jgi:hypothetical protein
MVSTSGSQLLPEAATKTLVHELLPVAYLVTPNIPEANLIMREAGKTPPEVCDLDGLKQLAASILALGPEYVLLKGGHLPLTKQGKVAVNDDEREIVANVLVGRNGEVEVVQVPFQRSKNTHGTGCSLASAIACNLAKDDDVKKAVRSACRYVEAAIKTSPNLGKGSGPLNHFHSVQVLPFSSYVNTYPRLGARLPQLLGHRCTWSLCNNLDADNNSGNFIEYLLERDDVKPAWHDYTHHEFCVKMGDGTLPQAAFKNYMIQDYLYLVCQSSTCLVLQILTSNYKTDSICSSQRSGKLQIHISR